MDIDRWVWIDIETTGLNPEEDLMLELAVVITDFDLNEQAEFSSIIVESDAAIRCEANGILDMHKKSGLLDSIKQWGHDVDCTLTNVERRALQFLEEECPSRRLGPMCGSTIAFDRSFLKVHMPELAGRFHYRNLDVSTVNELARCWKPKLKAYAKERQHEQHRALDDIHESIELLRFYRTTGFVG